MDAGIGAVLVRECREAVRENDPYSVLQILSEARRRRNDGLEWDGEHAGQQTVRNLSQPHVRYDALVQNVDLPWPKIPGAMFPRWRPPPE